MRGRATAAVDQYGGARAQQMFQLVARHRKASKILARSSGVRRFVKGEDCRRRVASSRMLARKPAISSGLPSRMRRHSRKYEGTGYGSRSPARKRIAHLGDECWVREKFSRDEAMHRKAPGIEALVIGVPLGCGIDPELIQAKACATLALSSRAHPLSRIGSAGFAGPTGTSFGCRHDNKSNMLLLLRPLPADRLRANNDAVPPFPQQATSGGRHRGKSRSPGTG